jgi:hypothetical protein
MSQGPNVFYGYADALAELVGSGKYDGPEGPYWLKSMVMDWYKTSENHDEQPVIRYAGITRDPQNLQTPGAKLLRTHFDGLSNARNWWHEVTLQRQEPEGMRVRVELVSSLFDPRGDIDGGNGLGEWWISDIQAAKGEAQKAIETAIDATF